LSEGKDSCGELTEGDEPVRFQAGVEQLHRWRM
jgi:hypothetical protein